VVAGAHRDNGVLGVDLQGLLGGHVGGHGGVAQGLRLHDALHVGAPAVLARHQHTGRVHRALAHHHLRAYAATPLAPDPIRVPNP